MLCPSKKSLLLSLLLAGLLVGVFGIATPVFALTNNELRALLSPALGNECDNLSRDELRCDENTKGSILGEIWAQNQVIAPFGRWDSPENLKQGCDDAEGVSLTFITKFEGFWPVKSPSEWEIFCIGAEEEKFFEINNAALPWDPSSKGDVFVSTTQGVAANPEQNQDFKESKESNEGCGFGDVGCWLGKILDKVVGIPLALFSVLPAGVLYLVVAILGILFSATAFVMKLFIENTMAIGVTPDKAEFVRVGLDITRGLVNILFLLILVLIGLATILRRGDYQAQKALPMLILIALLVNFSPLLVGFVVDMGNILTNAFLKEVGSFESLFSQLVESIGGKFQSFLINDIPDAFLGKGAIVGSTLELITQLLVNGLYFLLGYLILVIIMILFFVRVVALWVLAILAPLAFAAYILPATRQLWSQWFKNLIQWAFIGVPITFFLLLSSKLLDIMGNPAKAPVFLEQSNFLADDPSQLVQSSVISEAVVGLFGNFAVLALMAVGIFISMQFVPQGAQGAIDFGKKWGGRAALAAGSAAWRYRGVGRFKLKEGAGKTLENQGFKLRRFGEIMGMKPEDRAAKQAEIQKTIDSKESEFMALNNGPDAMLPENVEKRAQLAQEVKGLEEEQESYGSKKGGRVVGAGAFLARWAGRGIELPAGEIQKRAAAKDQREIAEGESEGAHKDSKDLAKQINQELTKGALKNQNRIVGLLNAIVENGDSDDLQEYIRTGMLSGKSIGEALIAARRGGPPAYRPLMKAVYGKMLSNPDQFGADFTTEKEDDGTIKRMTDGITPVFVNKDVAQKMVNEVPDKLKTAEIANGILGDTINKGKAGGREFVEHGGELVLKHLIDIRGGDLASALVRGPDTREGRTEVLKVFRSMSPGDLHKKGADGLITYLASTAAQGAGVVSPLTPQETREILQLMRDQDRKTLQPPELRRLRELIDTWSGGIPSGGGRARPGVASGSTSRRTPREEEMRGGPGESPGSSSSHRKPPEEEMRGGPT